MKKRLVVLFLFCVSWLLQAADSPKHEIRAVWLTTVYGLDWPRFAANSEHSRKAQQKAVSDMLDRLQDANFNTVFFQVRLRLIVLPSNRCRMSFPEKKVFLRGMIHWLM